MNGQIRQIRHALFGLAVLGALGFGAAQALASQRGAQAAAACAPAGCFLECVRRGYDGGSCSGGTGACACYYITP